MRLKNYVTRVTLSVETSDIFFSFFYTVTLHDFSFVNFSFDLAGFCMEVDQLLVGRMADTVFDQEDRRKRIKNVILFYMYAVFRIR
jgi:hypothetical protein